MPNNYVLLERIELNASAASVTFANIPQTGYTDLKVVCSVRPSALDDLYIKFNGSSASFTGRSLRGNGASATSDTGAYWGIPQTATANTFASVEFYIPNYLSGNNKSFSVDSVSENNATTAYMNLSAGLWSNTAAITSINIYMATASLVANSTFSLYGLAALGTTPTIAPKASGGNVIDYDGTYWIHTFNTNGTFTPQTSLSCDYLVVAGGGGGGGVITGNAYGGGGGGAGGFKTATAFSVSSAATVTIGGGGAGGAAGANGAKGSDSVFSTITSTGGGFGALGNLSVNNGGSGGSGGASTNGGTGGAASPSGEGNVGASSSATFGSSGGGGGASAAGSQVTSGVGGAGGAGTASSYSGTSVTYAGGGGGGAYASSGSNAGGAGGAGGGGNGGSSTGTGIAGSIGTINLGGGGGGSGGGSGGGTIGAAGGSGIVIIRYLA